MTPLGILVVALGGGIGALARFGCSSLGDERQRPWIIVGVNIAGSFVAGAAAALIEHAGADPIWGLAIIVGFCGGLTTFSTFATDAAGELRRRRPLRSALLLVTTATVTLGAAWAGIASTGFFTAQTG